MTTMTQTRRTAEDGRANDLFEIETHAIESHRNLGACETVKQIFTRGLHCVRRTVECEEAIAKSAQFRGDHVEHGIAWERVIHGTAIARAMENRLNQWF